MKWNVLTMLLVVALFGAIVIGPATEFVNAQEEEPAFGTLTPELRNLFTNKGYEVLKSTVADMSPIQRDAFKALLLPYAFPSGIGESETHPDELKAMWAALGPASNRDDLFDYIKLNIVWADEAQ